MSIPSYLEIPASLCGLVAIYLSALGNIYTWLFGAIMVSLYTVIFFDVKLYADMGLQIFFLLMQFYGWYQWRYVDVNGTTFNVLPLNKTIGLLLCMVGIAIWISLRWFLGNYTDSSQINWDVSITTLSILAQWMMSKRYIENWYLWIIVNLLSMYIYWNKSLYLTASLAVILLFICVKGYRSWLYLKKPPNHLLKNLQ